MAHPLPSPSSGMKAGALLIDVWLVGHSSTLLGCSAVVFRVLGAVFIVCVVAAGPSSLLWLNCTFDAAEGGRPLLLYQIPFSEQQGGTDPLCHVLKSISDMSGRDGPSMSYRGLQ